ncbi:Gfo/Idh/MocA family oxidoreductase [Agrococcus sp. ARC_14]|uniref:Gfo/Idh/MocA family protein n=1 Tax=Agrococcus sp. ARC_14 TaxID=2919927 RepID=UPI001F058618|nr:Gfo/Idh/MocA family oxidoreductase [Agrococcus sp. ARC_14]MCH1883067.1 Gfo/Idh/MocA family oxidoreductase [Agrococcus sp. ARC_14]
MSAPLGVAVLGTAFMGKAHSAAWRNVGAMFPDAPATAMRVLCGSDPERTAASARILGWQEAATDWREVVTRDDVQIVDICTPGHLHAEMATAALAAGKHVLVEKPLATSLAEAERMAAAAQRAAGASMLGFNYRRVPALALARQLVHEGRIGRVRTVRAAYLQDWLVDPEAPMTWRLRAETAGNGALGDLGSHVVDQILAITGQHVTGARGALRTFQQQRPGPDGPEQVTVDDAAWAQLELDGGTVASLEVSRVATGSKNALTIEVHGSDGALSFDLERLNELVVTEGRAGWPARVLVTEPTHPDLEAWWPPGHVLGWDSTFVMQAAALLRSIAAGQAPEPSFADGLAVQRVLDAIERSDAAQGAMMPLGDAR